MPEAHGLWLTPRCATGCADGRCATRPSLKELRGGALRWQALLSNQCHRLPVQAETHDPGGVVGHTDDPRRFPDRGGHQTSTARPATSGLGGSAKTCLKSAFSFCTLSYGSHPV